MYVRLAFSIATSIDPDILIIDEALSVGDQRFQKKCIDRIMEFKKRGKTILFCSHSMYHVSLLCKEAIWLHQGTICSSGLTNHVIQAYEDFYRSKKIINSSSNTKQQPSREKKLVQLRALTLLNKHNEEVKQITHGEKIRIKIQSQNLQNQKYHYGIAIKRNDGLVCFATSTQIDHHPPTNKNEVIVDIKEFSLLSGKYEIIGAIIDDTGNLTLDSKAKKLTVKKDHECIGVTDIKRQWII